MSAPSGPSADLIVARLRVELKSGRYKSQRDLADRIGVHKSTLNRWLRRKQRPNPRLGTLELMASEFGESIADLVSREVPPPRTVSAPPPTIDAQLKRRLKRIAKVLAAIAKLP